MRSAGYQPAEPLNVWIVTDGRAGIEAQALGLAEAIARRAPISLTTKRVRVRSPYSWLPAGFVPAPRNALTIDSDPIQPPWPDIFIGCGRASIPFAMSVRDWSNGKTFVVQLQDPRVNPREFDVVIPPMHDGLEGQNVLPIVGACNRITAERLEHAVSAYKPANLEDLPSPRFAILIGGKSKRQGCFGGTRALHFRFTCCGSARNGGLADGYIVTPHQPRRAHPVSHMARAALRVLLRRPRRKPLSISSASPTVSLSRLIA
ncbi:MAG: ELM1/GtrOC1 family putative glycosyltransferase [Hyphomonadaceae bacterium]